VYAASAVRPPRPRTRTLWRHGALAALVAAAHGRQTRLSGQGRWVAEESEVGEEDGDEDAALPVWDVGAAADVARRAGLAPAE
jgi:hypothetical protein